MVEERGIGTGGGEFSARAALLGAAVGIAGSAYAGTLLSNVALWFYLQQGASIEEAYARLAELNLPPYIFIGLVSDIFFA